MVREAYPFYHNVIPNEIWVFRAEGAKEQRFCNIEVGTTFDTI